MDSVIMNGHWNGADKSVSTFKTPSHLLLNEKREFEAFGYEAEKRYLELYQQGRHLRCFFFKRFKTKLASSQAIKMSLNLKDENGKPIPALKVFAAAIRFLKSHLLNALRMRGKEVATEDIKWMVTVPAFWNDVSKQFIRQAAIQAGIPAERLKLALEAEVASVFCQNMKGVGKLPIHGVGTTYCVADIGGGTTDVVFHVKRQDGRIKEMNRGGGCSAGSGHIDNAFLQFLVRVLGAPAVREFLDEQKVELLELLRDFEGNKCQLSTSQKNALSVKIPVGLERICRKIHKGETMNSLIAKSVYRDKIKVADNKLHFEPSIFYDFVRSACADIARCIKAVLSEKNARDCSILILVGGMAGSNVVQDVLKTELEGKTNIQRIIVPPEPELAILKGAVMFGHQPRSIFQRVIRYTYGLRKAKLFNPDVHPEDRMVALHGIDFITDVFCPFISAGSRAPVGFMSYDSLTSIEPFQKVIEIDVYFSSDLNPTYVTDKNTWLLGKIEYQIPNPSREERTIYIEFIFGDTELLINITDRKTAARFKNTFPEIEK
ncbi:heat shock 70 kDa protein 12B-like [Mercenaria mercenaria]|uniref:heat shock 70 kDa protein 12B-like n=1 Tax=Mercenaria mercenaria TaxID=6596 RepID=UPI00234EE8A5|nr:heat shock 70 kDa protein 12B-like [Mercenaria mercenaria]